MTDDYLAFLRAKVPSARQFGEPPTPGAVNPILKPHQRAIVEWMVSGGRRACFAAFGLGKSVIQLEAVRLTLDRVGGRGLIVLPLGVRQEFMRDAAMLGTPIKFIRRIEETNETGIHLTNYETVRDGKLDPRHFRVASLDEAAVLRGFGGVKTFREFMRLFAGDTGRGPAHGTERRSRYQGGGVPFRFVATATPSPNEYIELLAYADFLGIMQVSEAKTRFFKRDSVKADKLTLHAHKEREFWLWVASWAIFLQKPSDLGAGFSDEGYTLPGMTIRWHEVENVDSDAGSERDGQGRLFANAALGITDASREKRRSMGARIAKMSQLVNDSHTDGYQAVVWCDLNDEQRAIEASLRADGFSFSSIDGVQELEEKEASLALWRSRKTEILVSKPVLLGSGVNLQQCAHAVFAGIGFKFADFIQAIHRVFRFLQTRHVTIDLIYTTAEHDIRLTLERKWRQHNEMVGKMTEIIREYGLGELALAQSLIRAIGTKRVEIRGREYTLVNNDSIEECQAMQADSVDLIVTSIPFSTQYEYTPSYNDLGHTDNDAHFFQHLGFLTPELLRILRPGRICAVHVKDRIVPGGLTGLGFQTVSPFSDHTVRHFTEHGFAFMARKTVVTDVVRENNQTYRLGWTEQCKDATKMGYGLPEYVLIFRKPQTDATTGYADTPVVKQKAAYSRSRWQTDAHGFARSNGNRLLTPEELVDLPHEQIFKLFRDYYLTHVYDFEHHVRIGEALEEKGLLPVTFMLLQPPSHHPDVWTDIARMRTLNMMQERKGQEQHLCPIQFDIVDRLIAQFSMKGETVLDPFGGLMTVPYRAVLAGRRGVGIELNPGYFTDGATYCKAAEEQMSMPTLFDLDGEAA